MQYNIRREDLLKYLIVVVLVVLFMLVFIITKQTENSENIDALISQRAMLAEWPEEIPVIKNKTVNIEKVIISEDVFSWKVKVESDVTHADFKDYLLKLSDVGFDANKEMGSQHPYLLTDNPVMDDNFYIMWFGKSEDYNIEVYWRNINNNEETQEYVMTVSLYKPTSNITKDPIDMEITDENVSGDILESSGDAHLTSGDKSLFSGDVFSGDNEKNGSGESL